MIIVIENLLKNDYYIADAAVIGDKQKYVSALIVPNFEALEPWAQERHINYKNTSELVNDPLVLKLYETRIDEATLDLGQVEKINKFTILPHEFSQETGELTPTLKVRRKVLKEIYSQEIAAMYAEE